MTTIASILLPLFENDVSIRAALGYLFEDIDREALFAARMGGEEAAIRKAAAILAEHPAGIAIECFVARPWERRGRPNGPYLGSDGKPVAYPVPGPALSELEKIPEKSHAYVSIIDVADDAKSKCKICKAAIDAGQPRLVVPAGERDDDFFHLDCAATKKKLAAPLAEARRRSRTG